MAKSSKSSDLFKNFKPQAIPAPKEQAIEIQEPTPEKEIDVVEKSVTVKEEPQVASSSNDSVNKGGRPLEYTEKPKQLKLLLPPAQYNFLRDNGGRYGGMTKYIQHLIEKEMKRRGE